MRILGVITRVSSGEVSQGKNVGDPWQMLMVEGIALFLPPVLHADYCMGQRVQCELLYTGDKKRVDKDGVDQGYHAGYQVLSVRVIEETLLG